MKLRTRKALPVGLGLALVMLVAVGWVSYQTTLRLVEDSSWVAHTHEVLEELADVLAEMTDAETGQRGYLITGDEKYLEPYRAGLAQLEQSTKDLRRLTADNPEQQWRLDALEILLAVKLAELRETIDLRREEGFAAAAEVVLTDKGKEVMDDVRRGIGEIESEERELLAQRDAQARVQAASTTLAVMIGTVLSIALLLSVFYWLNRQIGERERAEEQLKALTTSLEQRVTERTTELEASNKELEAFTYSVSHDLRAPLRQISGFSNILEEELGSSLDSDARHHLERIQEGARYMGQLVDDLLNLSRIGRWALNRQVTGLNSLVEEARNELKAETEGREIEWWIGRLPFVECDPALMKQVFANLLSNALKYTRPRERAVIEVDTITRNGQPGVFVRDNGVGFSMKHAAKLFGVFQRLHRQEDFEGTGVGLATVQRIVHKHGGYVWAEAELDQGAAFYFVLGAAEERQPETGNAS